MQPASHDPCKEPDVERVEKLGLSSTNLIVNKYIPMESRLRTIAPKYSIQIVHGNIHPTPRLIERQSQSQNGAIQLSGVKDPGISSR